MMRIQRFIFGMAILIILSALIPVFFIFLFLFIIWGLWDEIRKLSIPKGKRINHRRLKDYMRQKYGKKEGDGIYRSLVQELKKKGFQ